MSARRISYIALIALFSLVLAGVAAKLAARQQSPQQGQEQKSGNTSGQDQAMPGMNHDMPGMDMSQDMPGMKMGQGSDEKNDQTEHGAMDAMSHMHHHRMGPHMYMTKLRSPATPRTGPRPMKS